MKKMIQVMGENKGAGLDIYVNGEIDLAKIPQDELELLAAELERVISTIIESKPDAT